MKTRTIIIPEFSDTRFVVACQPRVPPPGLPAYFRRPDEWNYSFNLRQRVWVGQKVSPYKNPL